MDPWSSTYVCLIVVKWGFDCRSSGENLAGKSWASVLACDSAAPLPLGNWHMSGIRHTGSQATSLRITKKMLTKCLLSNWFRHLGHGGGKLLIIFIQVLKWIYVVQLICFHIYLPWRDKVILTQMWPWPSPLTPLHSHFLLLPYLSQL